jgi:hypothetical protein
MFYIMQLFSYPLQLKESFGKGSYIALLRNGRKVPLSRTGYGKLKEMLGI